MTAFISRRERTVWWSMRMHWRRVPWMCIWTASIMHPLSCRNSMICPVPVIIRAGLPRQRRRMHRTAEVFVICRFLWRILERQAAKQCSGFVVRAMCGSAAGDSRRLRRTDGSYCEGICIRACRMQIQQKQYTRKRGRYGNKFYLERT